MKVKTTTPLLIFAAVLSSFSFPFTIHATGGSGSGSGSDSGSVSDSVNEKPPVFFNFRPKINGRDSAVIRLQKTDSREALRRLAGVTFFLAREIWTSRVDFSTIAKGTGNVDDDDADAGEGVDIDNDEVQVQDEDVVLRYHDIATASYYGGPRDTPFRLCRFYDDEGRVTKAFGPREVASAERVVGIECYAIYYRGIPTSRSYDWFGLGL